MFPALEAELKQEVGTPPSPGTPQKSNTTRSEGIFWWHLFLAGDLDPQDRIICMNVFQLVCLQKSSKTQELLSFAKIFCVPFVKSSVLFERTFLLDSAFPFTDSS